MSVQTVCFFLPARSFYILILLNIQCVVVEVSSFKGSAVFVSLVAVKGVAGSLRRLNSAV